MIKALANRIIVLPIDLEKKEEKKVLIIPKKTDFYTAVVIAYGSDIDSSLEKGDIVYILRDSGIPIEINGEEFISVLETHVLAAWKDK